MMGSHWIGCKRDFPQCPCIRCARDRNTEDEGEFCCVKHKRTVCADPSECKDFLPEDGGESCPEKSGCRAEERRAEVVAPYGTEGNKTKDGDDG